MNPAYEVEMTFVAMAGKRPVGVPAIAAGERVFVSVAGDARAGAEGDARAGADIGAQTRDAVARLGASLASAGLDLSHVADVALVVTDAADAAPARRILAEAIGRPPAGTTWVCGLMDPGARVEISATAVRP